MENTPKISNLKIVGRGSEEEKEKARKDCENRLANNNSYFREKVITDVKRLFNDFEEQYTKVLSNPDLIPEFSEKLGFDITPFLDLPKDEMKEQMMQKTIEIMLADFEEIEKTPEILLAIDVAQAEANKLLAKYGIAPFNIPIDNYHFYSSKKKCFNRRRSTWVGGSGEFFY